MDRNLFLKIGKNTFYQGLAKIATAFSTLIITVIITRTLGIAGYGDFTKAFSLVALFYLVADFGLNATVLKLFIKDSDKLKTLIAQLFGLRLLISLFLLILVMALTFLLPYDRLTGQGFNPQVKLAIIILSSTIFSQGIFLSANSYFQYKLRYSQTFIVTVIASLVTVFLVIVFAKTATTVNLLALAYLVGSLVLAVLAYLALVSKIGFFKPAFNTDDWFILIKKTLPIGLALIFNLIYFRVDTLIISLIRPTAEVALYGLAYKIFEISLVVPIFFINSLYPVLLETIKVDSKKFVAIVRNSFWLLLSISFLVSLFLIYFADQLILVIGGNQFSQAVVALQVLATGLPFFYLSALLMWLLVVFEKQKLLIIIYAIGGLFNLISNLILIPRFGYLAAAVTTGLSEGLVLLVSFYLVKELIANSFSVVKNDKIS